MPSNSKTVDRTGAPAGAVLRGVVRSNRGLRLLVTEEQASGDAGPVAGEVILLDAGDNWHAAVLEPLLGVPMDAANILAVLRRDDPRTLNLLSKCLLEVGG